VGLMGAGRTYRLEVQGHLGDLAGRSFPRMRIVYETGNTVLLGPVRDQAELTGMLLRFSDLGVNLLSVNVLDDRRGE
jgi:hypothetical protein